MPRQSRIRYRTKGAYIVAALVLSTVGLSGIGAASAANSCGTLSFSFEGTRLINDGISHEAGPFAVNLPGGTYDVMMRSADAHSTQDGQEGQEAERWWFSLDSGWHSVATIDLPDTLDANTTVMRGQTVPDSGAITLHHLGQGGVNSVNPVCVGFTAVEPQDQNPNEPGDPNDGNPADPGDPGDGDDPGAGDPNNPDNGDPNEPARANPDPGDPGDPNNPDDPGRSPNEPVVPELAITGSGVLTLRLVGTALILLQVGFLFVLADRRRTA